MFKSTTAEQNAEQARHMAQFGMDWLHQFTEESLNQTGVMFDRFITTLGRAAEDFDQQCCLQVFAITGGLKMMDERLARTSARTVAGFGPDTLEKSKTTTREATHAVQYSYMMVSKAAVDFSLELIDVAQENLNAAFDFARQLREVKSPSIFFEVSATQVRKQFENLTRQTQEFTDLAQKAVTDTAKCWQSAVESANQSA